jgi:hypothetical protein
LEEELYRQSRFRDKRGLAEEVAKFSLCFALSAHREAVEHRGNPKSISGVDVAGIKSGILKEDIRPGDEVEGEALACAYTAIYSPRAYYPSYFLGGMRAALRDGERAPAASAHYLPVSVMPPLPDGWGINFLYPTEKSAFDRPNFPAHTRDVLTRDFQRIPMLVPPGGNPPVGRVSFKARFLQSSREAMERLAGLGEKSYEAYSARGLTSFLEPIQVELKDRASMRGSLFAELSLARKLDWEQELGALEEAIRGTVKEVFPQCDRGERQGMECYLPHSGFHVYRFRKRLFALVFDPVFVVYRSPRLLGIFLPCDLAGEVEESEARFERFVVLLSEVLEKKLDLGGAPRVDIAYDNRLPWVGERGALKSSRFAEVERRYPFLKTTLAWLRGDLP